MSLFLPQKTYLTLTILSIFTSGCAYQAPLATIPARQIETQKESIDKYDPSKVFLQAGWYSEEQLTNLLNKLKDKK
jgi:hypothetical protein